MARCTGMTQYNPGLVYFTEFFTLPANIRSLRSSSLYSHHRRHSGSWLMSSMQCKPAAGWTMSAAQAENRNNVFSTSKISTCEPVQPSPENYGGTSSRRVGVLERSRGKCALRQVGRAGKCVGFRRNLSVCCENKTSKTCNQMNTLRIVL